MDNLLNSGANVSITMKEADLRIYSEKIVDSAIAKYKAELEANPQEVYYTIKQVCEIFSVDKSTLWHWGKRNYLNSLRVGGHVRYRKSDIDNILNAGK